MLLRRWRWLWLPVTLVLLFISPAGLGASRDVFAAKVLWTRVAGDSPFTGTVERNIRQGHILAATTQGDPAGALQVTLDYRPAFPAPGMVQDVIGSHWQLAQPGGTLVGSVVEGSLTWNGTLTRADVYLKLKVNGGTGAYSQVDNGRGTLTGTLEQGQLKGIFVATW